MHLTCGLSTRLSVSILCFSQVVNRFLLSFFLFPGDLAQLLLPSKNVEVIQGKMVVLQASFTGAEIQKNTVVWNYMSSSTEMVTDICYIAFLCSSWQ